MDIAERVTGRQVAVWGRNATVGTSFEELYAYDQVLNWPSVLAAAAKMDVSSSSTSDTAAGTGAQKMVIFGLDANYNILTEEVTMNGQTIVQTAGSFLRVFGAEVTRSGTGLVNAGDIHIVKTGTGGSYTAGVPGTLTSAICKVLIGFGVSENGMYTVPAGKTARLKGLLLTARAQPCTFQVASQKLANANDNCLHTDFPVEVAVNSTSYVSCKELDMVYEWKEKTDIRLRVLAAAASGICTGMMNLEVT